MLCEHVVVGTSLRPKPFSRAIRTLGRVGRAWFRSPLQHPSPGACPHCWLCISFPLLTHPACKKSLHEQRTQWAPGDAGELFSAPHSELVWQWAGLHPNAAGTYFPMKVSKPFLEHIPQPETSLHFPVPHHWWRTHEFWYSSLGKNALWSFKSNIFHIITQSPIGTLVTSSSSSFLDIIEPHGIPRLDV